MLYELKIQSNPEYTDLGGSDIFFKKFDTFEEFHPIENLCYNQRRIGLLESLVIPIRPGYFFEDLLFPSLTHHALKCNATALKIISSILFILLDICTLPIRAATFFLRYFFHKPLSKEDHPLYQYLINNKVPSEKLNADHIYLMIHAEGKDFGKANPGGKRTLIRKETFNFIQLPVSASPIKYYFFNEVVPQNIRYATFKAQENNYLPIQNLIFT